MTPSEIRRKVFNFLTAHNKRRMRVGRFFIAMDLNRIYSDEVICDVRIFETSGFLGLKRKLLCYVTESSKKGRAELVYGPSGSWYKEFEEALKG